MFAWLKKIWDGTARLDVVDNLQDLVSVVKWPRPLDDAFVDLTDEQLNWIARHNYSCCPYCHGALYGGPSGGMSQNMYCENVDTCNSAFNLAEGLPWGQFIGKCPAEFVHQMRRHHAEAEARASNA